MSEAQKRNHLKKLHTYVMKGACGKKQSDFTGSVINSEYRGQLSVPFSESNLSYLHLQSWKKAESLVLDHDAVSDAPGMNHCKVVKSANGKFPHFVSWKENGSFACDCQGHKEKKLCSHTIAVAHLIGCLSDYITWYHKSSEGPNLLVCATRFTSSNVGKKPEEVSRKRPSHPKSTRNDLDYLNLQIPSTSQKKYYGVRFLKGSKIQKCYGCKGFLRENGKVPAPPYDLVISYREYRSFPGKDGKLNITVKEEPTYYHINPVCIRQKNENFRPATDLKVSDDIRPSLSNLHVSFISDVFGVNL